MNRKYLNLCGPLIIVATAAIAAGEMVLGTAPAAAGNSLAKILGIATGDAAIGEECAVDTGIFLFDPADAADFSGSDLGDPVFAATAGTVTQDSAASKVVAGVFCGLVDGKVAVDSRPFALAAAANAVSVAAAAAAASAAATVAAAAIPATQKGAANGVATLGADGILTAAQRPA